MRDAFDYREEVQHVIGMLQLTRERIESKGRKFSHFQWRQISNKTFNETELMHFFQTKCHYKVTIH